MIDIASLSPDERLQLIERIWESLASTPESIPLTASQREELDRRLEELDRDGPTGLPAAGVYKRFQTTPD